MNKVLEWVERAVVGPDHHELDQTVLDFRNGQTLSLRAMMESLMVMASIGKGKTTLAKTITQALLTEHFGGLVLVVKGSQIGDFYELCVSTGRGNDCITFGPGWGHVFNALDGETSISEAAALVAELAEVLDNKVREGGENEAFWRSQLTIILKNLFALCWVVEGHFDLITVAGLFDGRANSLAELSDPTWQQTSTMAAALVEAKKRLSNADVRLAYEYFAKTYPTHGDRLQGSMAATVTSVLDYLRRSPLREMFTGKSTFSMDDILNGGKICIVGLPVLESKDGQIANAIMQFCFCRAATRMARHNYAFLLSDECQETVSRELMRKMALLRDFKIAPILMTQNIAVLDDKIGENAREGLCGLMGTKIFGPQGHAATREWAAEQIGKHETKKSTESKGRSHGGKASGYSKSTSTQDVWEYRVPPSMFAELEVGETICLRDGEVWSARWHRREPGRNGTVRVI